MNTSSDAFFAKRAAASKQALESPTADQLALKAYLEEKAAATAAWVAEDPAQRWACSYTSDIGHWAADGINSVAEFIHNDLAQSVYEATKDIFGYKPNWSDLMAMTNEELDAELASLYAYAADNEN